MNWLTGGSSTDSRRLISQLTDSTRRERAAQELMRLGAQAAPALIETLQSRDPNLPPIARQLLIRIGPAATPALAKALGEAHPLIRIQLLDILGQSRDPAALPALFAALRSEYYTVRAHTADILPNFQSSKIIPPLFGALKDPEDDVRIAAVNALGTLRDPSTFDELAAVLLDDRKIEVRQAAARALGDTDHPAALPFLLEALHDSFWWYERQQAAGVLLEAIEKMGLGAVQPLIEMLQDREGTVRRFAAILLGRLGDQRAVEPLGMTLYDLHHEVAKAAAESLAHMGGASFEALEEAARHPEAGVREHAIHGLGGLRDARVTPILLDALHDPERLIRKLALQALAHLRDPRAKPELQEIAADRNDRELATLAKEALQGL